MYSCIWWAGRVLRQAGRCRLLFGIQAGGRECPKHTENTVRISLDTIKLRKPNAWTRFAIGQEIHESRSVWRSVCLRYRCGQFITARFGLLVQVNVLADDVDFGALFVAFDYHAIITRQRRSALQLVGPVGRQLDLVERVALFVLRFWSNSGNLLKFCSDHTFLQASRFT